MHFNMLNREISLIDYIDLDASRSRIEDTGKVVK